MLVYSIYFIIEYNAPLCNKVLSIHVYKVCIVTALTTQSVVLTKSFNEDELSARVVLFLQFFEVVYNKYILKSGYCLLFHESHIFFCYSTSFI